MCRATLFNLPCEPRSRRKTMSLFRRGRFWHYEFQANGTRYRGSTKQSTQARARHVEVRKMQQAQENGFFPLPSMRLDRITTDEIAAVQLDGSPSWQNQALRTLSVILAKGVQQRYLHQKPKVKLVRELRREAIIDDTAEALLLAVAEQPLKDALVIMRDMGLRPDEVFRMRLEDVHWDTRLYFNPYGKSRKARRWIPMSQRVIEALKARAERNSEWVFPSQKAACGHLTTVAKQFRKARRLVGLPESLKLYGARHAFATYAVEATGNVFAVADAMGHEDLKTTRIYQHPEFGAIRDAIDRRNNRRVM